MLARCVCAECLLTFVSVICHYFDTESIRNLKRRVEDMWPQCGFRILCKVMYDLNIFMFRKMCWQAKLIGKRCNVTNKRNQLSTRILMERSVLTLETTPFVNMYYLI